MVNALLSRLAKGSQVKPLYAGDDHAAALVGPCLSLVVRGEPSAALLLEAPRWINRLLEAYPAKGGLIVVVQADVLPPGDVARTRIDRAFREYARGVTAGAIVIEGEGFVAASMHSVVSSIVRTSRRGYPIKTFADLGEGAHFVWGRLPDGPRPPAHALVRGVEELRAAYQSEVGPDPVRYAGARTLPRPSPDPGFRPGRAARTKKETPPGPRKARAASPHRKSVAGQPTVSPSLDRPITPFRPAGRFHRRPTDRHRFFFTRGLSPAPAGGCGPSHYFEIILSTGRPFHRRSTRLFRTVRPAGRFHRRPASRYRHSFLVTKRSVGLPLSLKSAFMKP